METQCPQCGALKPPDEEWKQNLCPACLMKLGLSGAIPAAVLSEAEISEPPARRLAPRWNWRWTAFLAGGTALLALLVIAFQHFTESEVSLPAVRFIVDASDGAMLQDFAVSPDGRFLVYTAASGDEPTLRVRPIDQLKARELPGTDKAAMPFWSPDSRRIGFFADDKLKTIHVDGGPPVTISDASGAAGGTWNADGVIVFAVAAGLQRVPATGGDVELLVPIGAPDQSHQFKSPQFLPDGSQFLFSTEGPDSVQEIRLGQMQAGESTRLIQNAASAVYANGLILFARGGFLLAQQFDLASGELTGEPMRLEHLEGSGSGDNSEPRLSVGGNVLAYRSDRAPMLQTLLWMDRIGEIIGPATESGQPSDFALSPDLTRIAVTRKSTGVATSELWLLDTARGATTRLTFDSRDAKNPLWASDGRRIAFTSRQQSETEIRWVAANGSATETLLKLPSDVVLDSWSPDGRFLAYTVSEKGKLSLWTLQLEGDRKPTPFPQQPGVANGEFNYRQARFSPDGRFVAYVSDESGRDEVYLRSFPSGDTRLLVSVDGGTQPSWRKDGRELFYLARGQGLTAVAIQGSGEREPALSAPHLLFPLPRHAGKYEVANDGRFLVSMPMQEHERSPVHLVVNWAQLLEK